MPAGLMPDGFWRRTGVSAITPSSLNYRENSAIALALCGNLIHRATRSDGKWNVSRLPNRSRTVDRACADHPGRGAMSSFPSYLHGTLNLSRELSSHRAITFHFANS
jgi:hypothetical protein